MLSAGSFRALHTRTFEVLLSKAAGAPLATAVFKRRCTKWVCTQTQVVTLRETAPLFCPQKRTTACGEALHSTAYTNTCWRTEHLVLGKRCTRQALAAHCHILPSGRTMFVKDGKGVTSLQMARALRCLGAVVVVYLHARKRETLEDQLVRLANGVDTGARGVGPCKISACHLYVAEREKELKQILRD